MLNKSVMTFGKFIAAIRDHRRVSQDKLAQAMGYKHRSMVARLEAGQRSWTLEQVEQIMTETDSKRDGAIIQLVAGMDLDERKAFCQKFDLDYSTEPREQSSSMGDAIEGQIIAWFVKRDRMAQIAAKQAGR